MTYPFRAEFVAIDPERYTAAYIDEKVLSGAWRLWSDGRAAILAEIRSFPTGVKEVHGIAAAGDLQAIVGLIPLAEQWGRENGCKWAIIESREGWLRMLPGYFAHTVAARKEL